MRVIGGTHRGRRLEAPAGRDTRPTSDRVREALFSSLSDRIAGAVFLDLYAGSGAVGIEAVSRGARFAALVERDRKAVEVARRNLSSLGIGADQATAWEATADSFCAHPRVATPFTVAYLDPPYDVGLPELARHLEDLRRAQRLADDPVVVVERDRRDPALLETPLALSFLVEHHRRTYGDTVLVYLRTQEPEL